jgi:4-amino-4-deoxy-L-arabinose transferase-like glycosyltransferase
VDVAYALTGPAALALAAAFFLASWGYGRWLVARVALPRGTRVLVAMALGSGLLGYVAFALGLAGLLGPVVLALVLLGGLAALAAVPAVRAVVRASAGPAAWHGARERARIWWRMFAPPGLPRWSAVAALLAAAFGLLGALQPESEYDALWYHLTFPARYLSAGRLLDIACEHMAPVPQHVELQYAYALLLGDARAAKLVHLGFGLLAALWTGWLAARLLGRRWAAPAVALFVTAPTVTWEMTTAYNELPLAFLATGAVSLVVEWRTRGGRALLALAGVLLGFGLAGKHVAYFFLAPLVLAVLLAPARAGAAGRPLARRMGDAALLAGVAVAVALPWYVRAWYYTGNPLYPMFYDVLARAGVPLRRWDAQAQSGWTAAMNRYGDGRSPLALLLVPWRATWASVAYAGSIGPAWLLFLPLLPLVRGRLDWRARFVALLGIVFLVLWVTPYSSFQIRYLVPVVPLLAVAVAAVVRALDALLGDAGWRAARRALSVGTAAVLLLNLPAFFPLADARQGWIPHTMHTIKPSAWLTPIGGFDHERFIAGRLETYPAVAWANRNIPASSRIVTFGEAAHFYARAEMLNDYSRCVAAGTWGAPPGTEERAYRALRAAGVTHILWDRTRPDLDEGRFAIRSPLFRARFAEPVYRDRASEIDALRLDSAVGAGVEAR